MIIDIESGDRSKRYLFRADEDNHPLSNMLFDGEMSGKSHCIHLLSMHVHRPAN